MDEIVLNPPAHLRTFNDWLKRFYLIQGRNHLLTSAMIICGGFCIRMCAIWRRWLAHGDAKTHEMARRNHKNVASASDDLAFVFVGSSRIVPAVDLRRTSYQAIAMKLLLIVLVAAVAASPAYAGSCSGQPNLNEVFTGEQLRALVMSRSKCMLCYRQSSDRSRCSGSTRLAHHGYGLVFV